MPDCSSASSSLAQPPLRDDALHGRIADPGRLADTIAAHLSVPVEDKQVLLETAQPLERLERAARLLEWEIEKLRVDKKIHNRVKKQMEKAQKEYYLNEKIKAIQQELGRKDDRINEIEEFRQKIEKARHARRGQGEGPAGAQAPRGDAAGLGRGHRLAQLPGVAARGALVQGERASCATSTRPSRSSNEDHYGLEKIKERILEFLAVRQLVKKMQGLDPVLRRPAGRGQDARSPSRSPAPPGASSCACRWAACATRPRSAAIAAPTSAPSPGRSSR